VVVLLNIALVFLLAYVRTGTHGNAENPHN
jgi:hypothetical protein